MECDLRRTSAKTPRSQFQSTHSVWSATKRGDIRALYRRISIHALRVECDYKRTPRARADHISIHALRVECDLEASLNSEGFFISIHALRVECDFIDGKEIVQPPKFQSTHSVWSATSYVICQSFLMICTPSGISASTFTV